jgi:hypothetical protein
VSVVAKAELTTGVVVGPDGHPPPGGADSAGEGVVEEKTGPKRDSLGSCGSQGRGRRASRLSVLSAVSGAGSVRMSSVELNAEENDDGENDDEENNADRRTGVSKVSWEEKADRGAEPRSSLSVEDIFMPTTEFRKTDTSLHRLTLEVNTSLSMAGKFLLSMLITLFPSFLLGLALLGVELWTNWEIADVILNSLEEKAYFPAPDGGYAPFIPPGAGPYNESYAYGHRSAEFGEKFRSVPSFKYNYINDGVFTTGLPGHPQVEFKTILYGGIILQGVVHSCRACLAPTR